MTAITEIQERPTDKLLQQVAELPDLTELERDYLTERIHIAALAQEARGTIEVIKKATEETYGSLHHMELLIDEIERRSCVMDALLEKSTAETH